MYHERINVASKMAVNEVYLMANNVHFEASTKLKHLT